LYPLFHQSLVWQNKETGRFEDLTEEQFNAYVDGGIVSYNSIIKEDVEEDEGANGTTGDSSN